MLPRPPLAGPGDCLFIDRYSPHRAMPNDSGRARWALVAWIKPHAEA